MKRYTTDDKAVIALASMMTDEEVMEEFSIFDRQAEEAPADPGDEKLVLAVGRLLQRLAKEQEITVEQLWAQIETEAEDPEYRRRAAAVLRLERAS